MTQQRTLSGSMCLEENEVISFHLFIFFDDKFSFGPGVLVRWQRIGIEFLAVGHCVDPGQLLPGQWRIFFFCDFKRN